MKQATLRFLLGLGALAFAAAGCAWFVPKDRWNPGDPGYNPGTDPNDRADAMPVAPSGLVANAGLPGKVTLSWQDNSGHETGFVIERKDGDAGQYAELPNPPSADAESYEDITVAPLARHVYRVQAQNALGVSAPTAEAGVTAAPALSELTLSAGTLSPVFSPGQTTYTAEVGAGVFSLTVTPAVSVAGIGITVNGTAVESGAASLPLALETGANSITVVLTPVDTSAATVTYTLTVTALGGASSNADLASLTVSAGTLAPAFERAVSTYTVTVPETDTQLTVTPTAAGVGATIVVNGTAVSSGAASQAVSLAGGSAAITIVVTAQDGVTTRSYTVTATPTVLTPSFTPPAGTYSGTQSVAIDTSTGEAIVRYTKDGSTPSSSSGTLYVAAVLVTSTTTLKALAYKSG